MTLGVRSGQIGLMLLVVMGVVVSLVLSVAARSFTDIALSRREKENNEAFAIAESGVEQALLSLSEGSTQAAGQLTDLEGLVSGNYGISESASYDLYVEEGETAQIDLSGTPSGVVVSWVKSGENPGTCVEGSDTAPAAVEIAIISSTLTVSRQYYNASGCDLSSVNNFAQADAASGDFQSQISVNVTAGDRYMRIKPLYHGTTIKVTGNNLASQLYLIQSQAKSEEVKSDIEVKRTKAAPGSIFDYALFSSTTIIK